MPDIAALVEHLRARPHDGGSWLVYGDFLLEHGDMRGELMRLDDAAVAARIEEHGDVWRGGVPRQAIAAWRYGFVTAIELPFDGRTPATLAAILADPQARFVTTLRLRPYEHSDEDYHVPHADDSPPDTIAALAAVDLTSIRSLALRYLRIGDAGLRTLLTARLGSLTTLDLRYGKLGDAGAGTLAASPILATVRELYLQRNDITEIGARALAASPHLGALEVLDVRYNAIGDTAFTAKTFLHDGARTLAPLTPRPPERETWAADGLTMSPAKTARFTATRFVDARALPDATTAERPSPDLPHVAKVYVDPREWSFATFENIVPLDSLFDDAPLEMTLDYTDDLAVDIHRMVLKPSPATRALLDRLDTLPLYVSPLNANSRGGQRYIFHSALLADALTKAVRDVLPLEDFSHVNPVFRCNRFEPDDDRFHRHFDTPYFDAARHHVSKYTLLVYLTGGRGTPALRFDDRSLDAIEPLTCLAMHQRHPHEGSAYTEGRKVFLRTELVFEAKALAAHAPIGHLFSKACYLTGESVARPELAGDADAAYNRVAQAHWTGRVGTSREPFVHKQFRGTHWLANGFDFWFPKSLSPVECAALTLLDYFNCKIAGAAFRAQCTSDVLRDIDPDDVVARFPPPQPIFCAIDKAGLFPPKEIGDTCCPGHCPASFDPTLSHDIIELYDAAQRFAKVRIDPAPILMMGQHVLLDPSRFVVDADKIHVLSAQRLAPINFAACWNCRSDPPNFLDVDADIGVLHPLVPPILWEHTREACHLMFDFFRNSWAVSHKAYSVPVPHIRDVDWQTVEESDEIWLRASRHAAPDEGLPIPRNPPWWTRDSRSSPIIRELFQKR